MLRPYSSRIKALASGTDSKATEQRYCPSKTRTRQPISGRDTVNQNQGETHEAEMKAV